MKDKHVKTFKELEAYRSSSEAARERGRLFERLLNDIFEDEGVLRKPSYFTNDNRSQQIDGAIKIDGRYLLLEVKWVDSSMAASDLYSFIGKIDTKLEGTLGVFISRNELSENFMNSLSYGRRRKVVVIHGNDIDLIFKKKIKLEDYIKFAIERLSLDNLNHVSVQDYIDYMKSQEQIKKELDILKRDMDLEKQFINELLESNMSEVDIDYAIDSIKSTESRLNICKYLMWKYEHYNTMYHNNYRARKIYSINYVLSKLMLDNYKLDQLADYYIDLAKSTKNAYLFRYNVFSYLTDAIRESSKFSEFRQALIGMFESIIGDWDSENMLTQWISTLWDDFSIRERNKLYNIYLDIYIGTSRKDKFEQKSFANNIIQVSGDKQLKTIVTRYIYNVIKKDIEQDEVISLKEAERAAKYMSRSYRRLMKPLGLNDDDFYQLIYDKYIEISGIE